jgi:hypothetical protein
MGVEVHDPDRAGDRVVEAGHRGQQDRVVSAHHRRHPAGRRLGASLRARRLQGGQEIVGNHLDVSRVQELFLAEGHHAVLVDPVEMPVLDAHPHPVELSAHLVGRVPRPGPAQSGRPIVGHADEGHHEVPVHRGEPQSNVSSRPAASRS